MVSANTYLTCSDLLVPSQLWTILQIDQRLAVNPNAICVRFAERPEKLLALNAANVKRVADLYGTNPQAWIGQKLKVYCLVTASPDDVAHSLGVCAPEQSPFDSLVDSAVSLC